VRLWSLHPKYLDRQGLVACWREALLAQAVLAGRTKGYRHHPQLQRFRACADPVAGVGQYLRHVATEADARSYRFDRSRIIADDDATVAPIDVTDGQLTLEMRHLAAKLAVRNPDLLRGIDVTATPQAHPLFRVVPGPVESWEQAAAGQNGARPVEGKSEEGA